MFIIVYSIQQNVYQWNFICIRICLRSKMLLTLWDADGFKNSSLEGADIPEGTSVGQIATD